jgi:hypothetical protein
MPPNSLHGHDESAIEKTAGSGADTLAPLAFVLGDSQRFFLRIICGAVS